MRKAKTDDKEKKPDQTMPPEQSQQPVIPQLYATSDSGETTPLTALDFESDEWIGAIYSDPHRLPLSVKEQCFHNLDAKGRATGVNDERIYQYLIHTQHIFVCGGIPYIYKDGYFQMDTKGTIIKTLIRFCMLEAFVKSSTIDRIFKLFLQDFRIEKFPEDMNDHGSQYINFQNGMYDAVRKKVWRHNPKIMSVNQIPWSYDPAADHGPGTEIEKFLKQSIPDPDDREMLLEYIGLCCTKDVTQQKMMVICGDGGTGKSTIINLIQKMVGKRNVSNVAMSKLAENFQAIRMMGKLLNACADLEIDALDDVTMIKKLIGEDSISDSYKGKDVISFDNYAKLLFSTNELPIVRNEKTEGFYRRLMVLVMNEKPQKRDPDLPARLEKEMPYLIHLAMEALYRMYERGYIFESQNSKDRVVQLRNDSDTIEAFLNENYERTHDKKDKVNRVTLFDQYAKFCEDMERQAHTKQNFFKALQNKGFRPGRTPTERFFYGLKEKNELVEIPQGSGADLPFD